MELLTVQNLRVYFYADAGVVKAIDGVNLTMNRKEVLGLVGETGCGKSMTALSVMRLIPSPGRIVEGKIIFAGEDLLKISDASMQRIRGGRISMVFQEPMTSLNPVYTIGDQIGEAISLHKKLPRNEVKDEVCQVLRAVKMPDPEGISRRYPHELSGGMRQRAMIAMAISCDPDLLIADEPTTALDVTIQAQILKLLMDLKQQRALSILLITHDFGIVADTCDRVAVMYAGRIAECASVNTIFDKPLHPYTQALLGSVPKPHQEEELTPIPGTVPDAINLPTGCRFHPRCSHAKELCARVEPSWLQIEPSHSVACHMYE